MEPAEWYSRPAAMLKNFPARLRVDPQYGGYDCDSMMFLGHFDAPAGARVLEIAANEEPCCRVLADNGYDVTGIDLRTHDWRLPHNYRRIEGDFVPVAKALRQGWWDCVFSLSALEHFGLPLYGFREIIEDYDCRAVHAAYGLLKRGGTFYVTVPFGREFLRESDWRVYDKRSLQERIVGPFDVERKVFFLSGGCDCPDDEGIVAEADADAWCGKPPHVTVLLCMVKK